MNTTFAEVVGGSSFELNERDAVLVLEFHGELGSLGWHTRAEDPQGVAFAAIDGMPRPRMVIDLSGVTYAGSEFIGFLLRLKKRIRAGGGGLVLAHVQPGVAGMLHATKLNHVIPCYDSLDEAMESVRQE